jgi:hypothetical protein
MAWSAAIMLVVAFARAGEAADAAQQLRDRLQRTKTVSCAFSTMTSGDWQSGQQRATTKPASLNVSFDAINTDEGSARAVGELGKVDVVVRFSEGTLHFMESFREGPLYITTIFPVAADNGRLIAVNSRHEYTSVQVPGYTSRPEQYYGSCRIDD